MWKNRIPAGEQLERRLGSQGMQAKEPVSLREDEEEPHKVCEQINGTVLSWKPLHMIEILLIIYLFSLQAHLSIILTTL